MLQDSGVTRLEAKSQLGAKSVPYELREEGCFHMSEPRYYCNMSPPSRDV